MTTLGHVSDLHIWRYAPVSPLAFVNKRMVGGTNMALNRNKHHSEDVVRRALTHLDELNVDHIAISGDLTNLALQSEFEAAAEVVASIRDATERVSIIPGNHDYYTPDAARAMRFERTFEPYMVSELPQHTGASGYPYVKFLGDHVALISLNSGVVSPPMFAIGRVRADELQRLDELLQDDALADRCIVVQVHHHLLPFEHSRFEQLRKMVNDKAVLELLRRRGVRLVLHGHNHCSNVDEVPHLGDHDGTLIISGCSSTSVISHPTREACGGSFNVYTFDGPRITTLQTFMHSPEDKQFHIWRTLTFDD